jgi:hypothetical protein
VYTLTAFLNDERFTPRRIVFCDDSRGFSAFFSEPVERVSLYRVTFLHSAVRFAGIFQRAEFLYAAFSVSPSGRSPDLEYTMTIDADGTATCRTADDFDRTFKPFREGRRLPPHVIFGTEWLTHAWQHSPAWEPSEDPPDKQAKRVAAFRERCHAFKVNP